MNRKAMAALRSRLAAKTGTESNAAVITSGETTRIKLNSPEDIEKALDALFLPKNAFAGMALTTDNSVPIVEAMNSEEQDMAHNDALLAAEAEEEGLTAERIAYVEGLELPEPPTEANLQAEHDAMCAHSVGCGVEDDGLVSSRPRRKRHYIAVGPLFPELVYIDARTPGVMTEMALKYCALVGPFRTKEPAAWFVDQVINKGAIFPHASTAREVEHLFRESAAIAARAEGPGV